MAQLSPAQTPGLERTSLMKTAGFTMLELMVVVILIAVLTTLALPKLTTAAQKANIRSTRLELSTLVTKARAAAIQRGCVDSLHINRPQAWVTACKVRGSGRDHVGPVDKIGHRGQCGILGFRGDQQRRQGDPLMNRRGFTIVEIMIAVVILCVGLLGLASAGATVTRMLAKGKGNSLVADYTQKTLDSLRSLNWCSASPTKTGT